MTSLLDRGAGRPWERIRQRVLARDRHCCTMCGACDVPLQIDHVVERWAGGGDDMANLVSLCLPCHHRKSAASAQTMRRMKSSGVSMATPTTPRSPLTNTHPPTASHGGLTGTEAPGAPRFWPEKHPDAVATRGGELADYAAHVIGQPLLPWQRAVADELLVVDAAGRWCRSTAMLLVPRQSGKSTFIRALSEWLASQGAMVIAASVRLANLHHLMRPTQVRVRDLPGYSVKFGMNQPEIAWPGSSEDSHRWLGQAANALLGRGFSASVVVLDEVQDIDPVALEAVSPSLTEVESPLLVMTGTAPRGDSPGLLEAQRRIALEGGLSLFEWSAPPGSDWLDEEVWRQASPRWTPARLRRIREDCRSKGELHIRSEYLCQATSTPGSEPWLDLGAWQRARQPLDIPDAVQVAAVEDGRRGTGGSVALAWSRDGVVHVVALMTDSLDQAWREASRAERVLCGLTLRNEARAVELGAKGVGRKETATALPELRRLLSVNGLVWDGDDLDDQIRTITVREDSTGSLMVAPNAPSGVMRAAAWAVQSVRISREPVLV